MSFSQGQTSLGEGGRKAGGKSESRACFQSWEWPWKLSQLRLCLLLRHAGVENSDFTMTDRAQEIGKGLNSGGNTLKSIQGDSGVWFWMIARGKISTSMEREREIWNIYVKKSSFSVTQRPEKNLRFCLWTTEYKTEKEDGFSDAKSLQQKLPYWVTPAAVW